MYWMYSVQYSPIITGLYYYRAHRSLLGYRQDFVIKGHPIWDCKQIGVWDEPIETSCVGVLRRRNKCSAAIVVIDDK